MPHVIIKLAPGLPEPRKRALTDEIVRAVMQASGLNGDSVSVAFQEVELVDWAAQVYRPDIQQGDAILYKAPGYRM